MTALVLWLLLATYVAGAAVAFVEFYRRYIRNWSSNGWGVDNEDRFVHASLAAMLALIWPAAVAALAISPVVLQLLQRIEDDR